MPQGSCLILEDDPRRVRRFAAAWERIAPGAPLVVWRDAGAMVRELYIHLPGAAVISLDHDLVAAAGAADPGDGLDVAKFLVAQAVRRPVIIPSSNADRATMMAGEFELAGWPCRRVAPVGDDWIEADWRRAVEGILAEGPAADPAIISPVD